MTAYLVLRREADGGGTLDPRWIVESTSIDAASAEAAIRLVCQANGASGTYVAVPVRSWKPVTVQAVQTTTIKLGQAGD